MFWRKKEKIVTEKGKKLEVPDGLWQKCDACGEILYRKQLEDNLWVCPKCSFHFRIGHRKYIEILLDNGKIELMDNDLSAVDPLKFPKYKEKVKKSQEKTSLKEGVVSGLTKIGGIDCVFVVTDFDFIGGSMGSVVGERVARAIRKARELKIPLIILTASGGGARMQEGIFSLMQMVKTSGELALLAKERIPYITILTHPTMAGVMASFASLGDIILAEPGALLGFTGPRVIEQTIKEKLPEGFQRSEFLLKHGFVDIVVQRKNLRDTLIRILDFFINTRKSIDREEKEVKMEE